MERRPYYSYFAKKIAFANGKMAFVAGPRQVGKTTFAQGLLEEVGGKYFNWDDIEFKRQWVKDPKKLISEKVGEKELVVFDELHKAPRWKSSLKGVFDLRHDHADILVTGSARLDVFRRGGDSLLGRYYLLRMHPFSMGEVGESVLGPDELAGFLGRPIASSPETFSRLCTFGGFPEPFLKYDPAVWNLWRRMKLERLVREDLLTLTQTHELSLIESCAALLPERVGSPFSLQSLREELGVSHPTASRWIGWLSQLFYLYLVPPYSKRIGRSLKKQPKIYLWDWSQVTEDAARFENLVAGHLLKGIHWWTDSGIGSFGLFYLRDKEKREVDFLVTREGKPWMLVECKMSDRSPSPHLNYFAGMLKPSLVVQTLHTSGVHESFSLPYGGKGFVISADAFLKCF